jgi:hypothetical protein
MQTTEIDSKQFIQDLKKLGACSEAVCWAGTQPDLPTLWANCERADWMLWLAGKKAGEPHSQARKKLVGCATECAATAIQFVKNEEWKAGLTEVAALLKRYSESEAGDESAKADVIRARELAREIRNKDAYAADAAADAADHVTDFAADAAADAAAYAAYAADAYDRKKALKDLCEIVRRHYPQPPVIGKS